MTDQPAERRAAPRTAATFRIRLGFADVPSFVAGYAANISKSGIFVPTRQPREKGTEVRFELLLKDGSIAISGIGGVVWTKPFDAAKPAERYGMGVRFTALDGAGNEVLQQALAWRVAHLGAAAGREIADEVPEAKPASAPTEASKPATPPEPVEAPEPLPRLPARPKPLSKSAPGAAAPLKKPVPPPKPKVPEVSAPAAAPEPAPDPQAGPAPVPEPPAARAPEPEPPPPRLTPQPAGGGAVPLTFEDALRQALAAEHAPDDAYEGVWKPGEKVKADSHQEIIDRLTQQGEPAEASAPDLALTGDMPVPGAPGGEKKPGFFGRLFGRGRK